MKKVAIIGAGIFGCSIALALSDKCEVHIFERNDDILQGASTNNHLRYHYGYHYPRSPETVSECLVARDSFEKEYGQAIQKGFPAYYGVSKNNTKTSPEEFKAFCKKMNLPYVQEFPEENLMNRKNIELSIRTSEEVYDPEILKKIVLDKLSKTKINLHLSFELVKAKIGKTKTLYFKSKDKESSDSFDFIINASYTNLNSVNKILGLPEQDSFYEFVELLEIFVPNAPRVGLTIIDGEFSSILPRGAKNTFTLGHVKKSILKEKVSNDINSIFSKTPQSNSSEILRAGIENYPFLKDAKIVRSIFIPRVVKANVDSTDKRPTEIIDYGNGIYSIFAGKVVTAVVTAQKIRELLLNTTK